jgi:hypothetical protein
MTVSEKEKQKTEKALQLFDRFMLCEDKHNLSSKRPVNFNWSFSEFLFYESKSTLNDDKKIGSVFCRFITSNGNNFVAFLHVNLHENSLLGCWLYSEDSKLNENLKDTSEDLVLTLMERAIDSLEISAAICESYVPPSENDSELFIGTEC